jgi:segregation and condensation protein B
MTHKSAPHCPPEAPAGTTAAADEALDLSPEDIEAAYTRALAAVAAVERAIPELADVVPAAADDDTLFSAEGSDSKESVAPHKSTRPEDREPLLQPRRIIEAALFVGGEPLTAKRLTTLLGCDSGVETAQQLIAGLNEEYAQQARPYEIRLREGGYSLSLRPEFEDVRDRVYGRNPKEVTLSQDALEVLALVAYRQPVRCADLEAAGKANAAAVLRQLLRRQLVGLQRNADDPADVTYTTTARFLEVFGLRNLADLPLPDDLAFK